MAQSKPAARKFTVGAVSIKIILLVSAVSAYTNPFEPVPSSPSSPFSPPAPPNPPAPPRPVQAILSPPSPPSPPNFQNVPPPSSNSPTIVVPPPPFYATPSPPPPHFIAQVPWASLEEKLSEKSALLEIKSALGSHPLFELSLWNETNQNPTSEGGTENYNYNNSLPCGGYQDWSLLFCTHGHVTSITLDSSEYSLLNSSWAKGSSPGPISGELPWDSFLKIPYLRLISLQRNSLTGIAVPENIDKLSYLASLKLVGNSLGGKIPEAITRVPLITLELSENQIEGPLPQNLQNLTALETFRGYQNKFTGGIPESLGNLSNLAVLDFSNNNFNGTIPESLGNLTMMTNLIFQSNQLSGILPSSLSKLTLLKKVDLGQNRLRSEFPSWIGNLSSLSDIDLSNNEFYGPLDNFSWNNSNLSTLDISKNYLNGSVPLLTSNKNPSFTYDTNCFNSTNETISAKMRNTTDCSAFYSLIYPVDRKSSKLPLVAIVVPSVLLVIFLVVSYMMRVKRRMERLEHLFGKDLSQRIKVFRLKELKSATKNFSKFLGKGGYGSVYRADFPNGTSLAAKKLDGLSKQGDVEFIREVELLSRLHHRHLVDLVGFCAERNERILVYEFMAMGSLYHHLHGPGCDEFPLSWESRMKIAIHVAFGLEYLHCGADPPLIHRDVKSANILLNSEGYAKVADFGLCKEAPMDKEGSETLNPGATAVRGSFGYLDPEYVNTSVLSEKSDVYSYGVVLLELITGKKSIYNYQPLAYWAAGYLSDKEKMPEMVDPALGQNYIHSELISLCEIASSCVQERGALRPSIRDVAKQLVEIFGYFESKQENSSTISIGLSESGSALSSLAGLMEEQSFSHHDYSETLHWAPADAHRLLGSEGAAHLNPGQFSASHSGNKKLVNGSDESV